MIIVGQLKASNYFVFEMFKHLKGYLSLLMAMKDPPNTLSQHNVNEKRLPAQKKPIEN